MYFKLTPIQYIFMVPKTDQFISVMLLNYIIEIGLKIIWPKANAIHDSSVLSVLYTIMFYY